MTKAPSLSHLNLRKMAIFRPSEGPEGDIFRFILLLRYALMTSLKDHLSCAKGDSLPNWFQCFAALFILNYWTKEYPLSSIANCFESRCRSKSNRRNRLRFVYTHFKSCDQSLDKISFEFSYIFLAMQSCAMCAKSRTILKLPKGMVT